MLEPLRIELFGGLRVIHGDRTITRFQTQKTGSLLAYLAYHLGRSHSREILIDQLWPDHELQSARNVLSIALSSLRRQLEPPGVPAGTIIQADRFRVQLNPAAVRTDVAEFYNSLRAADSARDVSALVAALSSAIDLYAGEFLPGYYEDWVIDQQTHLRHLYEQAEERLAQCRRQSNSRVAESTPQRTIQKRPPVHAHETQPIRLPLTLTRFFGREDDIAHLRQLVTPTCPPSDTHARLVTLIGPGGSGKTRLAAELASRIAPTFAGGLWFVPLADLSEAALVSGTIADVMQISRLKDKEPREQITTFLNDRPGRVLLVLDNLEHLLSEGRGESEDVSTVVRDLLEQVPALTCLLTSRSTVGLEGERIFEVLPLPLSQGLETTPESLIQFPSVQLFVDRAQAAQPEFQLTDRNSGAVAKLSKELEGVPLAIELAAARAHVMTPAKMLSQMTSRLDFLVSRRRPLAERHRSLRMAIQWSFELLSPELQEWYLKLSVFRGGWTAEAAESVTGDEQALENLTQLKESSLIQTYDSGETMRFRMLETLREFACERISAEEQILLRRKHADYFLDLAERAAPELFGSQPDLWLACLESEIDNLRAALDWCEEDAAKSKTGLKLVRALWRFWYLRSHLREGDERAQRMLRCANSSQPSGELAFAWLSAGSLALALGNVEEAARRDHESLRIAREIDDREAIARARYQIGCMLISSDVKESRDSFEQSLPIFREIGDERFACRTLGYLAFIAMKEGDFEVARQVLNECLEDNRRNGRCLDVASDLLLLGVLSNLENDPLGARDLLKQSLRMILQFDSLASVEECIDQLGRAALALGDPMRAAELFSAAKRRSRELGCLPSSNMDPGGFDANVAKAREALGEEAFAAAHARGEALSLDQAIALALDED